MNLLMASGHPDAIYYPLGRVFDESNFVVERMNSQMAQQATLTYQAIIAVMPGTKREQRGMFTKALNAIKVLCKPIGGSTPPE